MYCKIEKNLIIDAKHKPVEGYIEIDFESSVISSEHGVPKYSYSNGVVSERLQKDIDADPKEIAGKREQILLELAESETGSNRLAEDLYEFVMYGTEISQKDKDAIEIKIANKKLLRDKLKEDIGA